MRLDLADEKHMIQIELLAPAKNLECGIAAINCGADAVYVGPERFGAREQAGNNLRDIGKLVDHARRFWAKVYVTMNTILRDDEIPASLKLMHQLHGIGIDGLIIQDVGLLECDLPPIPLIASTQMHNDKAEKIEFLEKIGFKRVILARELDLEEIKSIRIRSSLELEVFVHGALCVCYSGQCAMSYAIGGRSGNRGQCAQPCRRLYSLHDEKDRLVGTRHWLSLKDLNLSDRLRDLIDAGITSFKIEGRLKDRAYVMNITRFYRETLDRILDGTVLRRASSGVSINSFTPNPGKTFNRGYTTYFLQGRSQKIGRTETPKYVGELLGTVDSVLPDRFTLTTETRLTPGDGICFFDRTGTLQGSVINHVEGKTLFPDKPLELRSGIPVYRNHDHRFIQELLNSQIQRKIRIEIKFFSTVDGIGLLVMDEDGNEASHDIVFEKQSADKKDQAIQSIQKQLTRTGDTPFICTQLDMDLTDAPFVPVSMLNGLRRQTLEKLVEIRLKNRPAEERRIIFNDIPYPEKEISYLGNVLNMQAASFYRRHGVTKIEPAAESGLDMRGRKVMTTKYCLRFETGLCTGRPGSLKSSPAWILVDEEGRRFRLHFDCVKCRMEIFFE
jgi:23S rRNA 5-hydroxycytidine C2501 synthase